MFRQDFDRYRTLEPCIFRPVDFPHSTRAESRYDFVRAKACAGLKGHTALNDSISPRVPRACYPTHAFAGTTALAIVRSLWETPSTSEPRGSHACPRSWNGPRLHWRNPDGPFSEWPTIRPEHWTACW